MTVEDRQQAARAAASGRELPADQVPALPGRTLQCNGPDFKRYRALALTGRRRSLCCLPIINPIGRAASIWLLITNITDLTYTAFIVALSVAFNHQNERDSIGWLSVMDVLGSCIYVIDIYMGFHVGIIARWDSRVVVVRDSRTSAWFYVAKGTFFTDLLATLPMVVQIVVMATESDRHILRFIFILRLLRLYRVARLLRNLAPGSGDGTLKPLRSMLSTRTLLLLNAVFTLVVLVNLMGCIWWNLAENEGLANSWAANITGKDFDLLTASNVDRWVVSCYFALTTMVTIGYGDITPVTVKEVGITILFEVVGVAFFGYILNVATTVLAATGPAAKRAQEVKQKLQDVEDMMHGLDLHIALKRKIRAYFAFTWAPQLEEAPRYMLYRELPPQLRTRLVQRRQEAPCRELKFFPEGMRSQQRKEVAALLAAASVPVWLRAGQQLSDAVAEVATTDAEVDVTRPCFYILDEGEMCALHPGDSTRVQRHTVSSRVDFSGPAVIGLSALFSPAVLEGREASESEFAHGGMSSAWEQRALALTECHLWRVDCLQLSAELRDKQPAVLLYLVGRLLTMLGVSGGATAVGAGGVAPGSNAAAAAAGNSGLAPAGGMPAGSNGSAAPAGWQVAAPAQQQPPTRQGSGLASEQQQPLLHQQQLQPTSFRSSAVAHLLQTQAELEAAIAAQKQRQLEQGRGLEHQSVLTGRSTHSGWQTGADAELDSVVAAGQSTQDLAAEGHAWGAADVWHND